MLVLTRNIGEVVHVGDGIKVTVIEVTGNQVKLGFDAPRDVNIVREELLARSRPASLAERRR